MIYKLDEDNRNIDFLIKYLDLINLIKQIK